LGVWGRFGYGDAEYNYVTKHYSGGVQFQHFNACWHRDVIGVGYGIAEPGDTVVEELGDPDKEHFVEVYYRRVFNDFAHLSPFAQFVKNPLGDKESDSAFVLGLRGAFEI
ncbi:MAG: carbohydrate porin, partial [Thermoguttaceae bacterium]|nr:carbohydrate porin [Thermoguttaceae bacterium]